MIAFGIFGCVMIGVIALTVRPWFSETRRHGRCGRRSPWRAVATEQEYDYSYCS